MLSDLISKKVQFNLAIVALIVFFFLAGLGVGRQLIKKSPDYVHLQQDTYFYIQNAPRGSFIDNKDETFTLTLNDISKKTIFTSVGFQSVDQINTEDFINNWNVGSDNLGQIPPSAVISVQNSSNENIVMIAELSSPTYNFMEGRLTYLLASEATKVEAFENFYDKSRPRLPDFFTDISVIIKKN